MDESMESLSDEERISPRKVLQVLEDAWLNEKFCPELLPHNSDYVDCMMEQIGQMENNLNNVKKNDFRSEVHSMELARIRYVIASYLRRRLEKIEQFTAHILAQDELRPPEESYLTEEEKRFAKQYLNLNENLFKNLLLNYLPNHFQNCRSNLASVVPNLGSHVFLRANKDVQGVVIESELENQDEEIDLDENSQHILQYKDVSSLVKNGSVQLI